MTEQQNENTLEILDRLIGFDTVSRDSNLDLIDYVEEYLSQYDINSDLFYNKNKDKANLVAKIGEGHNPGVLLSGHTDVVPVEGQKWHTNPFELVVKDNKAFGRGTTDMKGFIASTLAAVPDFLAAKLPCPIYLVFSYDEEVGCVGVRDVLADIPFPLEDIRACIVGEPTLMKPVTAHTGKQVISLDFYGTAMHSSLAPKAVNAISYASKVICGIGDLEEEAKQQKIVDRRFEFPHPTINVGKISGGKAVNIVAGDCIFDVEFRYPPGLSADAFRGHLGEIVEEVALAPMKDIDPNSDVQWRDVVNYPAFNAEQDSQAVELVQFLTGSNETLAVNYGTEAGLFQNKGISTVVCGPGDIAQAHQPNEYIELAQLKSCDAFLRRLTVALSQEGAR
jgi:acetylornithine deacetylase